MTAPTDRQDRVTDVRSLVILALFILSGALLGMIYANPGLLHETAFMMLVTLIIGQGGLGAVTAFLFGGTKTGSDVMKAQSEAVIAGTPPPPPGTITTTHTAGGAGDRAEPLPVVVKSSEAEPVVVKEAEPQPDPLASGDDQS
jgi:hypothetical protein